MEYAQPNFYVDSQERQDGIIAPSISPAMLDEVQINWDGKMQANGLNHSNHGIPLPAFNALILKYPVLAGAVITKVDAYGEYTMGPILHRFLVMELEMELPAPRGHGSVFLRMDRRMNSSVTPLQFVLKGGIAPARDTACLATEKLALINNTAMLENSMTFPKSSPPLNSLCPLFHIMCTDLSSYMLWPANCWFFVSLIQEHLFERFHGYFEIGELKWGKLALDIRSHVSEKVRLDFHLPSPPMVIALISHIPSHSEKDFWKLPGLLQLLAVLLQPRLPKHFAAALELSKHWDIYINSKKIPSRSLGHKLIAALKQLLPALTPSELLTEEISTIFFHATSVARVL
ncbi:hypothetical protein DL93DRAFT_2161312, partial [Clavulina sp. PMI_390]